MEDHTTRPESGPVDPLARLRELEEEAAQLRASLSEAAAASGTPVIPQEPAEPEESVAIPSPAEQAEIDRQLAFIMLSRKRGDKVSAEKTLAGLEGKWPEWPTILEMRGDFLLETAKAKDALDYYKRAKENDPANIAIETKYAKLVLRQEQAKMPFDLSNPAGVEVAANAKIAALLSIVVPGLGQLVTGQIGKGILFLATWLVGWIWVFMTPGGLKGLVQAATGATSQLNAVILLPLFMAIGIHLVAIFDAASKAKGTHRKLPQRPEPPANLPFE